MVKMVDVAKHAGVSVKTVSRVMNNELHVSEALRSRVFKSVEELGYIPSTSARNLRSNRTYALHLIVHSQNSNYVNAVQAGALIACQKLGYNLLWAFLDPALTTKPDLFDKWCSELSREKNPDGIILVPPYSNNEKINARLDGYNIPIVRIGPNSIEDSNITLSIDEEKAAHTATRHLIELGHRRIAFIRGFENQRATHERFNGYRAALKDAGIEYDESIVLPGEFSFRSGMIAGEIIIKMKNRPTAVFAANDDMAAGMIVAGHRNQVKMPEEISVVGFDDSKMAGYIWPSLTAISQPRFKLGERAVELLVKRSSQNGKTSNNKLQRELLDYELIVRDSTGPAQ